MLYQVYPIWQPKTIYTKDISSQRVGAKSQINSESGVQLQLIQVHVSLETTGNSLHPLSRYRRLAETPPGLSHGMKSCTLILSSSFQNDF